jgi:hypothetical protein
VIKICLLTLFVIFLFTIVVRYDSIVVTCIFVDR